MITPHTLTVTGFVEDGVDERTFTLTCPGVNVGQCGGFRPCETPDCPAAGNEFNGGAAHGVYHSLIDDEWMVETGECYYIGDGADGLSDAVEQLELFGDGTPLDAGEYPVEPDYDGDGAWTLSRVEAVTSR